MTTGLGLGLEGRGLDDITAHATYDLLLVFHCLSRTVFEMKGNIC